MIYKNNKSNKFFENVLVQWINYPSHNWTYLIWYHFTLIVRRYISWNKLNLWMWFYRGDRAPLSGNNREVHVEWICVEALKLCTSTPYHLLRCGTPTMTHFQQTILFTLLFFLTVNSFVLDSRVCSCLFLRSCADNDGPDVWFHLVYLYYKEKAKQQLKEN